MSFFSLHPLRVGSTLAIAVAVALFSACGGSAFTANNGSVGGSGSSGVTIAISPQQISIGPGATQQFIATVKGTSNTAVAWQVNGLTGGNATVGAITAKGLYTAPQSVPSGPVQVSALSQADTSRSADATVTIDEVTISPSSITLQTGVSEQFTAVVYGTSNQAVSWLVGGVIGGNSQLGTITSNGDYTAPQVAPSAPVKVEARSVAEPTYSATATVTVAGIPPQISVVVAPGQVSLMSDQTQQFSATVTGTSNQAVTWLVDNVPGGNASVGTITANGFYTAPLCSSQGNPTVTATSQYDGNASGNALVTLSNGGSPGTYYVATSGADGNDGSACHPWGSISQSALHVKPGSIVHVAPGTYYEAPTLNTSGTAQARIRYISDVEWGARIDPASADSVVTVNGSYIDVVGFDVGGGQDRIGILDWGSYNHTLGNRVHDIPGDCTSAGGGGIVTANWNGTGAEIVGNLVYNIAQPAGSCNKVQGIYQENSNAYIANNLIGNVAAWGLECAHYCQSSVFVNNTVFHSGGGLWVGDTDNGQMTSNIYGINNIFYDIVPGGNWTACAIREYPGTTGPGDQYINNVIDVLNSGACTYQINSGSGSTITGTVFADPQFVNYQPDGSGNYHLQSNSPAINSGVSLNAPSIDFQGGKRPIGSAWDIGVYEYGNVAGNWPWY